MRFRELLQQSLKGKPKEMHGRLSMVSMNLLRGIESMNFDSPDSRAAQAQDPPLKLPSMTPLKNASRPPAADIEDSATRDISIAVCAHAPRTTSEELVHQDLISLQVATSKNAAPAPDIQAARAALASLSINPKHRDLINISLEFGG